MASRKAKAKLRLLRANFSKEIFKKDTVDGEAIHKKLSLSYTFETEKKGIPKSEKRAPTKLTLSIMYNCNDIYSHLQHVRQADLFFK